MSAFIALTALKEAVGLTGEAADTIDDGVLQSLVYRASALVDGYLSQIRPGFIGFSAGSNSRTTIGSNTRTYDGSGDEWLWIDDAASVSSVSVDDTVVASTSYHLWPYNESVKRAIVYDLPSSSLHGLVQDHFPRGTANVAVAGYFGIPFVPDDVAQVTLALAILLWRRYQSGSPLPDLLATTALDEDVLALLSGLDFRWRIVGVWGG